MISVPAPAKLNLYLHITGKREDGYHTLDSLVNFTALHDIVSVEPANGLTLQVTGPFAAELPSTSDNIIGTTAKRLRALSGTGAGAAITLDKRLPVASGIGGGSADAAATITALCRLWRVKSSADTLAGLALGVGADVPVCLAGRAAFMGGIGEELTSPPLLPKAALVLVNPGITVSTSEVFKARNGPFSAPARFVDAPADVATFAALLAERGNDLTAAAIAIAPLIGDVLAAVESQPGCLLARMSGSGATCFGLFEKGADAAAAVKAITSGRTEWWGAATVLAG